MKPSYRGFGLRLRQSVVSLGDRDRLIIFSPDFARACFLSQDRNGTIMGQRRLESRRFAVWQRDEIEAFVFVAMVGLAVVVAVMWFLK